MYTGSIIGFGLFFMLAMLVMAVVVILAFIFWILMIIDCAQRDFKTDGEKIVWILVVIFLHLLGALIYYFAVKSSHKKNNKKSSR